MLHLFGCKSCAPHLESPSGAPGEADFIPPLPSLEVGGRGSGRQVVKTKAEAAASEKKPGGNAPKEPNFSNVR